MRSRRARLSLADYGPVARRRKPSRPDVDRTVERYYVYRLFDDQGGLLYIGRSADPKGRRRSHERNDTEWAHLIDSMTVDSDEPLTWDEACAAEREAIYEALPPHNREFVTHHPRK